MELFNIEGRNSHQKCILLFTVKNKKDWKFSVAFFLQKNTQIILCTLSIVDCHIAPLPPSKNKILILGKGSQISTGTACANLLHLILITISLTSRFFFLTSCGGCWGGGGGLVIINKKIENLSFIMCNIDCRRTSHVNL